jgi:predicted house-cleaning NTP pyrophosphatase (Maf/HAM1 superfamily)
MLLPYSARLRAANVRIVLASLSPRRQELMSLLLPAAPGVGGGPVPFKCVPSTFAEDLLHEAHDNAAHYACETSMAKAREVWARTADSCDVLIAADTVVALDGRILEKPACE